MLQKFFTELKKSSTDLTDAILNEFRSFLRFILGKKILLVILVLVTLLAYGVKVFNYDFSIDTGRALYDYEGILASWEGIHRYSLVFLKEILFPSGLNIFLANLLTLMALILATLTILYVTARISGGREAHKKVAWLEVVVGSLFVTSPIVLEQINFSLQSFEVVVGTIIATIAPFFVWFGFIKKNYLAIVLASLLYAFCISIYQSFAPYIIMLSVFIVFMSVLRYRDVNPYKLTGVLVGGFIGAFIIYVVVSYILALAGITEHSIFGEIGNGGESYLESQIAWSDSISTAIMNIKDYIVQLITGEGLFYTILPLICTIIIVFKIITENDKAGLIIGRVVLLTGLCLTAILLAVVLGQGEEIRARYPVQPVLASLLVYVAYILVKSRKGKVILLLITIPFIFSQVKTTSALTVLEQNKYQEETVMASEIIGQMHQEGVDANYEKYHLIVIGDWKYQYAANIREKGMMIGVSHFEGGSPRVTELFSALGYRFASYYASEQSRLDHTRVCIDNLASIDEMKPYPSPESIKLVEDNFVIIKLSNVPDYSKNCTL